MDQAIGYGKSAMVFHMARRRIGDKAFWKGLRQVAREKMFAEASWADFARAFDPGGKVGMQKFMAQWVKRPGAPQLELGQVRQQGTSVTGEIRQRPPFYGLQLPLRLETSAGSEERTVALDGESAAFRMDAAAAPQQLQVDPDAEVFRRLAPEEIPESVDSLRSRRPLLVVVASTATPLQQQAARNLLAGLGRKADWEAEDAVDPDDAAGHDLLLVGWPAARALQPPLPTGLRIKPGQFILAGQTFDAPGAVLYVALPVTGAAGHHVALFYPLGDSGAAIAARKIPHYGKYSYLAFVDGNNRVKGVWPVTTSPLLYCWPPARGGTSRRATSCAH